jgi:hypothetical protein
MANISLTIYTNGFFASVRKSPIQMGSLSVHNSVTNISRLGTFKYYSISTLLALPSYSHLISGRPLSQGVCPPLVSGRVYTSVACATPGLHKGDPQQHSPVHLLRNFYIRLRKIRPKICVCYADFLIYACWVCAKKRSIHAECGLINLSITAKKFTQTEHALKKTSAHPEHA